MASATALAELAPNERTRYDGPMSDTRQQPNPDEITYSTAKQFMAEQVGMTEWIFVRRVRDGTIPRHYKPFSKRPYYLLSELRTLVDRERARLAGDEPPASE